MNFKEFLAMREGLLAPDKPPMKGLSRINPFPTTNAHRRRLQPKPVTASNAFRPTVAQVIPQNFVAKPMFKPVW
jgi:hypothetical protein